MACRHLHHAIRLQSDTRRGLVIRGDTSANPRAAEIEPEQRSVPYLQYRGMLMLPLVTCRQLIADIED